ncbi:membrane-bound lytic murein transglycosylase B [Orbus hercynius]|uniref:Membrane-bound lytic murein transglycosylase B n=1 Tax=Orbus hercynius TaxID=593135 RepID=A0A495RHS0_9GAMM|nr:lytic murein transglycosylase [Orbus hercynius]RKS86969.1 membrane-bound lytic murein transglycosylase B [Orbus hercynius]
MKLIKALVLIGGIAVLWGCASQSEQTSNEIKTSVIGFDKPREVHYFPDYIEALKHYAKTQGINDKTIEIAFTDVHFVEHVVQADKNQPEKKSTLDEYLTRAVSPTRIKLAQQKYLEFHDQIRNATLLTHVPQTYILALWGVESGYGKYQGKEDIISALSTLAFEGRRETFFTKELMSALTILQNGHIEKSQFKGSWAGAMGQNQFMPSSYLAYGLDGDGDGVIDIWNNMSDVFASTANYLATVGWQANEGWGNKIKLPDNFDSQLAGLDNDKVRAVSEWLKTGITFSDSKAKPNNNTQAWVIIPDVGSGQGYLVYRNFRTLMHWNRSYPFAISVGMLADSLTDDSLNNTEGN